MSGTAPVGGNTTGGSVLDAAIVATYLSGARAVSHPNRSPEAVVRAESGGGYVGY